MQQIDYACNSPPDSCDGMTILGLPGKIGNANIKNLNQQVEVFLRRIHGSDTAISPDHLAGAYNTILCDSVDIKLFLRSCNDL